MADQYEDKECETNTGAERYYFASTEAKSADVSVQRQEDDGSTTSVTRTRTKHGHLDLVPEPSEDPRDPLNWSMAKKCTVYSIMIYGTFCGIATAVANVLATPQQAADWRVTPAEAAYSISCVLAGMVLGPVLVVPLVRVFGVMSCCFWSAVMILVTSIWSAVSTGPSRYGSFLAARFVAGLFCATAQVFTGGVIADIFFVHQRGRAFAIYSSVFIIGQVGGPTFSGYIVEYASWTVCFWWTVGAAGLYALAFLLFGDETSWDRVRQRPVAREEIPETWMKRRTALFFPGTKVGVPNRARSVAQSLKATILIGISPVTILAGTFGLIFQGWAIMAGVQVAIILQTPKSYGGYSFSAEETANFFFSAWVGAVFGVLYGILVNDRLPKLLQKRNQGIWHAEYRLHTAWFPSLIVGPVGCAIFGVALKHHWHWIVLAAGEAFIIFAAVAAVPPQTNYIIEIWKSCPQEVSAILNVWRIGFAVGIQLFYDPWVKKVRVDWVWGTAAFLDVFAFGCLVILMVFGPRLRRYSLYPADIEEESPRHDDPEEKSQASS